MRTAISRIPSRSKAAGSGSTPGTPAQIETRHGDDQEQTRELAASVFQPDGTLDVAVLKSKQLALKAAQAAAVAEAEADFAKSVQSRVGHRARNARVREMALQAEEDAIDTLTPEQHADRASAARMELAMYGRAKPKSTLGAGGDSTTTAAAVKAAGGEDSEDDEDEDGDTKGTATATSRERSAADRWLLQCAQKQAEFAARGSRSRYARALASPSFDDES